MKIAFLLFFRSFYIYLLPSCLDNRFVSVERSSTMEKGIYDSMVDIVWDSHRSSFCRSYHGTLSSRNSVAIAITCILQSSRVLSMAPSELAV